MAVLKEGHNRYIPVIVVSIVLLGGGYWYYRKTFHQSQKCQSDSRRTRKVKKCNCKVALNFKSLTLELNNNLLAGLTIGERKHIKTRRDGTSFLCYCTFCLEPGHISSRCDKRYKICVVGDSHTSFWSVASRFYVNCDVVTKRISGMTARGLVNVESSSNARHCIISAFRQCHHGQSETLLVQIGQVDVDYVWYYRQMKNGNGLVFEEEMKQSITNLFRFLEDEQLRNRMDNVKIIVQGVHPPPLGTEQMTRKLKEHFRWNSDLESEFVDKMLVLPSHRERTRMSQIYNGLLEMECRRRGIQFVEVLSEIVNGVSGVVESRFIKSRNDVHLDMKQVIPIYHRKFKEMEVHFAMDIDGVWENARKYRVDLKERMNEILSK